MRELLSLTTLQCTRVGNLDGGGRLAARAAKLLDLADDVHTLNDLAKDDVSAVEPRGLDSSDEELRAVRVGASIRHGEDARARVLRITRKPLAQKRQ